jgi:hypothetical protein
MRGKAQETGGESKHRGEALPVSWRRVSAFYAGRQDNVQI